MKLAVTVLLICCILCGCTSDDTLLDSAMDLRKKVLAAESCSFQAVITADYGDELYTFQMDCITDSVGNLQFTVTDPETISGITGTIAQDSAALTFDDKVLAFPMLADNQLTPVSAPWIFVNTLRSGYLTGCSREEADFCIYIDDSYQDNPLHLEIETDSRMNPVSVQIIWQDRRVLCMDIRDFRMQ